MIQHDDAGHHVIAVKLIAISRVAMERRTASRRSPFWPFLRGNAIPSVD